jgi:hypothetical protein
MANPITWRNINAPNFGASNQLGIAAGEQVNQGLTNLTSTFQNYTQTKANERNAVNDNSRDALLNRVKGFDNLAGYDGFKDQLMQEAQGLKREGDRSAVIGALNSRDNQLQQDVLTDDAFNKSELAKFENPIIQQAEEFYANKEFSKGDNLLMDNNISTRGKMMQQGNQQKDALTERNRLETLRFNQEAMATNINQAIATGTNEKDSLRLFTEKMIEQGITGQELADGQAQHAQRYQAYRGLTQVQRDQIGSQSKALDESYALKATQREEAFETVLSQLPVDEKYSFGDENRMSQAKAIARIKERVPEDTSFDFSDNTGGKDFTTRMDNDVLPKIRDALGLADDAEVPGSILIQASIGVATDVEFWGSDMGINVDTILDNALRLIPEYLKSEANFAERVELTGKYNTESNRLLNAKRQDASDVVSGMEQTNRSLTRITNQSKIN